MTAALPMGGQKITGMADPTTATDGATKNYVDTTTAAFFSTGDGKITLKTIADTGWILCDDGTFGSASSGSSNRANIDTQALFTLFFNNISDANAPILTSGGGATTRAAQVSASAAWAANCRMTLTKQLGRAIGIAGTGASLSARVLGQNLGEETHTLTAGESAVLNYTFNNPTVPQSPGNTSNNISYAGGGNVLNSIWNSSGANPNTIGGSVTSNAGGNPHNNMQPTTFWNVMVKL